MGLGVDGNILGRHLKPDTPDFSAHILTSIVRMEKEVHNLLTQLDRLALEEPNEKCPQCKSTSGKRKLDSEIQLLTHKRLWKTINHIICIVVMFQTLFKK